MLPAFCLEQKSLNKALSVPKCFGGLISPQLQIQAPKFGNLPTSLLSCPLSFVPVGEELTQELAFHSTIPSPPGPVHQVDTEDVGTS